MVSLALKALKARSLLLRLVRQDDLVTSRALVIQTDVDSSEQLLASSVAAVHAKCRSMEYG